MIDPHFGVSVIRTPFFIQTNRPVFDVKPDTQTPRVTAALHLTKPPYNEPTPQLLKPSSKMLRTGGIRLARLPNIRFISKAAQAVVSNQEAHGELPKELVSGAPQELITERVVRIYQESKPATQSGTWGQHDWRIEWDLLGKGNRWENDLIGYQSTGDYM